MERKGREKNFPFRAHFLEHLKFRNRGNTKKLVSKVTFWGRFKGKPSAGRGNITKQTNRAEWTQIEQKGAESTRIRQIAPKWPDECLISRNVPNQRLFSINEHPLLQSKQPWAVSVTTNLIKQFQHHQNQQPTLTTGPKQLVTRGKKR